MKAPRDAFQCRDLGLVPTVPYGVPQNYVHETVRERASLIRTSDFTIRGARTVVVFLPGGAFDGLSGRERQKRRDELRREITRRIAERILIRCDQTGEDRDRVIAKMESLCVPRDIIGELVGISGPRAGGILEDQRPTMTDLHLSALPHLAAVCDAIANMP